MHRENDFIILNQTDKDLLGITHDQPFKDSQLPYLHTLARAASEKAIKSGIESELSLAAILALRRPNELD